MSKIESYTHGQFSWIDLLTPNAQASSKFYGELFGWTTLENPTDQGSVYTMFQQDGLDVCGMGEMSEELKKSGMPAIWNSYVFVDDADAVTARAVDLGGRVEMPVMQVMDAGRMAILVDPIGARVSIWEAGEHAGAGLVNEPNTLGWNELSTREPEKAVDFYGQLFGWTFRNLGDGYNEIKVGERVNGGIRRAGPDEPYAPPFWLAYISVADCDATVARVTALGGQALMEPVDIEPGRFCLVNDPQGALLTVMEIDNPD
jgi:hypothetical protein